LVKTARAHFYFRLGKLKKKLSKKGQREGLTTNGESVEGS
jgi:hypothetical protein